MKVPCSTIKLYSKLQLKSEQWNAYFSFTNH